MEINSPKRIPKIEVVHPMAAPQPAQPSWFEADDRYVEVKQWGELASKKVGAKREHKEKFSKRAKLTFYCIVGKK